MRSRKGCRQGRGAGPGGASEAVAPALSGPPAARARRGAGPGCLPVLQWDAAVQTRRGRHRDAGGGAAPVDGDPDRARALFLPRLPGRQPSPRSLRSARLGRPEPADGARSTASPAEPSRERYARRPAQPVDPGRSGGHSRPAHRSARWRRGACTGTTPPFMWVVRDPTVRRRRSPGGPVPLLGTGAASTRRHTSRAGPGCADAYGYGKLYGGERKPRSSRPHVGPMPVDSSSWRHRGRGAPEGPTRPCARGWTSVRHRARGERPSRGRTSDASPPRPSGGSREHRAERGLPRAAPVQGDGLHGTAGRPSPASSTTGACAVEQRAGVARPGGPQGLFAGSNAGGQRRRSSTA